jgi:serine/threonine protein phosphatase PrpC
VPVPEIHRLASDASMERGARAMIEAANREGGPDNITVLLVEP